MQMKEITVGRAGCDVIIPDDCVSRKHAVVTLVNGQYVYNDVSKNGTAINGRIYKNEKVVVSPGTPIYLSNKVPFPWAQVLMLLPNRPVCVPGSGHGGQETLVEQGRVNHENLPASDNRTIGIGWGIVSSCISCGKILRITRPNRPPIWLGPASSSILFWALSEGCFSCDI